MDTKEIIRQIYLQAKQAGACDLFTGEEDLNGIVKLFTSPQGLEFCMTHRFPNMSTVRLFKSLKMEQYGIYIDAGNITLDNPETAVLMGRTSAVVNCDTLDRHQIALLHGAKALVNASKWAVVAVRVESGCVCVRNTSDNAMII